MTFVDTSALLAFLDRDAPRHREVVASAARAFRQRQAVTHNYVLVETEALAHRRLGAGAVRRLLRDVVPVLRVVWIDLALHEAAASAHLQTLRRGSSLVDRASFEVMRRERLSPALTLDDDFLREGFAVVPELPGRS